MSNIDRRQLLHCAPALALAAPLLVSRACGQDRYPSRPITLILPYPAGGGTDVIARVFARTLEQELGGTVVVVNKTGAGGNIATDAAANAKPDGYTLLIGNQGPMVVNPHLYKKLASDPAAMLEPISLIAEASLVIVVARKLQVASFAELLAEIKRRPGQLNYASASNASASHLATILLESQAGISARHIPYRGAAPALQDLLSGQVEFMITTVPSATAFIEAGQLTALAVTGRKRVDVLPNVPTVGEAGLPGYVATAWYGLLGPKGLAQDIVARLEAATAKALQQPLLLARLRDDGATPSNLRGAEFAAFMAREREAWGRVIKATGLSLDE